MFDVSLVLALHREGALLRRSLLSLRDAVAEAREAGISTELVVTLDRADEVTREALRGFDPAAFDGFQVLEVDNGSLGLSRNDGINAARGRYVATCDGDDLISSNTIVEMFRLAEAVGPGHLIFPQYVYAFGDRYHCWKYFPVKTVTPLAFIDVHPYTSRAFAPKSIFQAIPYQDARSSSGFAYEDWHFNAECVARGHSIVVAEDTILFYRQRSSSLLNEANRTSARQIRPSTLFEPETYVRITTPYYASLARFHGVRPDAPDGTGWGSVIDSPLHQAFIHAANAIDPAVHPRMLKQSAHNSNLSAPYINVGLAYHEICLTIGRQHFDEVFLLPFIATGGAERYVGDVMHALYAMRPGSRILVLLGEKVTGGSYIDRVPPNATVIDIGGEWSHLSMEERHLITLKLIQATAPDARLHLRQCPYAEIFFTHYKSLLRKNSVIFYRFCDAFDQNINGGLFEPPSFNFISDNIEGISLLVTDNNSVILRDTEIFGVSKNKWRCLPARQCVTTTELDINSRATLKNRRVLWASRIDHQKRPDLLPKIASQLARASSEYVIDAYGKGVLDNLGSTKVGNMPNLRFLGPYNGFGSLDHAAYDAFIYTSAYDGMPNVLLEAIGAGLPVIAPDVGGIREMIVDGETGLLLPSLSDGEDMAAAYALAIQRLCSDPELRRRLAVNALRRLTERHSPAAFMEAMQSIFSSIPSSPPRPQLSLSRSTDSVLGEVTHVC